MDLWNLVRIILRRWLVVLPVLLLTAGAAIVLVRNLGPNYVASTAVIIVAQDPEASVAASLPSAPFVARVLAEVATGPDARQVVKDSGGTSDYSVAASGSDPLLQVVGFGPDPGSAVATAQAVLEALREAASSQSVGNAAVRLDVLTEPSSASADPSSERFKATAAVVVGVNSSGTSPSGANPFAQLGHTATSVVAEFAGSPSFAKRLRSAGATGSFEISPDPMGPILRIGVQDDDPTGAVDTAVAVVDGLNAEFQENQEASGAPEGTWYHLQALRSPQAVAVPSGKARPLLALAGTGGLLAVSLALVVESLSRRGRSARPPGFSLSSTTVRPTVRKPPSGRPATVTYPDRLAASLRERPGD